MIGHNFKNNALNDNPDKLKPIVKTVFLNTDGNANLYNAVVGIAMLFFCILAGSTGVILCFADSFSLDVSFTNIFSRTFIVLVIFTVIYLLPSKWFTSISFLAGAGLFALYIYLNFDRVYQSVSYVLNLCLYKITQEGYIIGAIVDYGLAKNPNPNSETFINTSLLLLTVALVCIFSYIVYSKKSMWIALMISLTVIFPGFFYGLIPSYFSFSITAAFWVAVFAINIFETGYIEDFINRSNRIPEKKLEKYKYKLFKKQYHKNVKALKAEISEIVKSPNKEENSLRLGKLVRELRQISNNQDWFLRFYGLNKLYKSGKNNPLNINTDSTKQTKSKLKAAKKNKEKFLSPLKIEKQRIKEEHRKIHEEQIAEYEAHRKELRAMPIGERFAAYMRESFTTKVGRSSKSGYAGFFAFAIALTAIIAAQPLVSPKAKIKASVPEAIMETLTNTVEYLLVGSNSSVYGGYSGGMGGGFLLNPNGANFKYKPILKIKPTNNTTFYSDSPFPVETFQSSVVYLKGWYGNVYNGKMWLEADKTHVDDYEVRKSDFMITAGGNRLDEGFYFQEFTSYMQDIFDVSNERTNSELKRDSIVVEYLVSGGRLFFMPYFSYNTMTFDSNFSLKKEADLNISLARPLNALFKYPRYAIRFYSVDNVLNRAEFATEDLEQYLNYYENVYPDDLEEAKKDLSDSVRNEIYDIFGINAGEVDISEDGRTVRTRESADGTGADILEMFFSENFSGSYNQSVRALEPFYNAESAYYEFVKIHYLETYDSLPQEVTDLAEEITQDCTSDFERALAIEKYLADNHEYTLHPMMPEDPNKDFVYNFLFDTKEGYCTYYATSMVIMMRSLGIPARYVDGFLVDMRKQQKDDDGTQFITVYDSNAHAWPEVYFRGIGWIPFEPTTSIVEEPSETQPYVYTPPARLPEYDSMGEMSSAATEEEEIIDEGGEMDYSGLYVRLYAVAAVILVILVLGVVNHFINSKRLKYFKTARAKDAVVKMFAYTLKFLKYCGFMMYNDEGLKDFAGRVSSNLEIFTGTEFQSAADIMQKARYSGHEMTEDERMYVYKFVRDIRKNAMKDLKPSVKLKFRYMYFIL